MVAGHNRNSFGNKEKNNDKLQYIHFYPSRNLTGNIRHRFLMIQGVSAASELANRLDSLEILKYIRECGRYMCSYLKCPRHTYVPGICTSHHTNAHEQ